MVLHCFQIEGKRCTKLVGLPQAGPTSWDSVWRLCKILGLRATVEGQLERRTDRVFF